MAAVKVVRTESAPRYTVVGGRTRRYPDSLRRAILALADNPAATLEEALYLDRALGTFYGKTARQFMAGLRREGLKIDLIASHGQTVRHLPQRTNYLGLSLRATMQLGHPEQIAAETSCSVVCDFRQADIAAGNEGAPITGPALQRLVAPPREYCLVVNVGGMSNYFLLGPLNVPGSVLSADCGPGNVLSDLLAQRLFDAPFDSQGKFAAQGTPSERMLSLLTAEPFFTGQTRSTGREQFGRQTADRMQAVGSELGLSSADQLATAIALTARSIARHARLLAESHKPLTKLYLTGGGRKNRFLMRQLAALLPQMKVDRIDSLGIDGDLVEAACFAVMGEAALRSETLLGSRHAKQSRLPVPGRLVHPPR